MKNLSAEQRILLPHFIGLAVYTRQSKESSPDPAKDFRTIFSGTIVEDGGDWFWVSCGHSIRDLNRNLDKGLVVTNSYLVDFVDYRNCPDDSSGRDGLHPFHYAPIKFETVYRNKSYDYGYILLDPFYVQHLRSVGVRPVPSKNIAHREEVFDHYFLMGLPAQWSKFTIDNAGVQIETAPAVAYLERRHFRRIRRRLSFDLSKNILRCNEVRLTELGGMSGGPIIGVRKRDDGKFEWALVAIQSAWLRRKQTAYACPFDVIKFALEPAVGSNIKVDA